MQIVKPEVVIYTDGACAGNPGPGGWGALLQCQGKATEIFGYELQTTNNRMEIIAVIKALEKLKRACKVQIYTDSKYLQQGITEWIYKWVVNNWRTANKSIVKNIDLWQELYALIKEHEISWLWVKGHADNQGNIIADRLALKGKKIAVENSNTK